MRIPHHSVKKDINPISFSSCGNIRAVFILSDVKVFRIFEESRVQTNICFITGGRGGVSLLFNISTVGQVTTIGSLKRGEKRIQKNLMPRLEIKKKDLKQYSYITKNKNGAADEILGEIRIWKLERCILATTCDSSLARECYLNTEKNHDDDICNLQWNNFH